MHAFFTRHCEVFTLSYRLYTRIYYVRKEIAKNTYIHAHHRHTWVLKTTHRLWNGSWFHANLKSLLANRISLLVLLDACSGTELPSKSCHGMIQGLFLWISFKHWGFLKRLEGTRGSLFDLLQSCDNSCIIAKEKKSKTMSAKQAVKLWYGELLFSNCCCCCCYGSCANDFQGGKRGLNNKHPLHRCYRQSLEWLLRIQELENILLDAF